MAVIFGQYFVAVYMTATVDVFSGGSPSRHNRIPTVAVVVRQCRSFLSFSFVTFYSGDFFSSLFSGGFFDRHSRDIQ